MDYYGNQIFLMVFFFFFIIISFQSCCPHILVNAHGYALDGSGYFKVHGLGLEQTFVEENGDFDQKQVEKVSGDDQNEQKEALILQKFRALLGLKRFSRAKDGSHSSSPLPTIEVETPALAPAPAPAPVPLPSPAPVLHPPLFPIHKHSHRSPSRPSSPPPHHMIHKAQTDKGRVERVLVPVLFSAGAFFVVCVLGLICACGKIKKHRQKSERTMWVKKGKSKARSKLNANSLNPAKDHFYLNSSAVDLEQQSSCVKQSGEAVNMSTNHNSENQQELDNKSESENASSSSTREIMSVHDDAELVRYESDAGESSGDKIIPIECHSSEDESFHSFGDSNSSNPRFSNASAASLNDAAGNFPLNVPSHLPSSTNLTTLPSVPDQNEVLQSPCKAVQEEKLIIPSSSDCRGKFVLPPLPPPTPPPPPPPPPPRVIASPAFSSSSSPAFPVRASSSSPLPKLSPSKDLYISSESKQNLQVDLLATQTLPPGVPPPPCPPPFMKTNDSISAKGPPPPPCQLPLYTPLGKDGAPLPKLKPLHWDKVRAAPDRSMVWDKLRSSSFELDEEMIESLFGYNIQTSMKNEETKSKTPSPSKHVLEPKRLQNITILSKALNVSAEQVCDALMKGDGLSLQQLEALVKMVPTKEEESKLSSYKGDINELGSAEKFVKTILRIPFAFLRVEAMLYRETFEDEVLHLRNSFSMLEEACKELRSSRLFLKLLEAVLKTGNRMNVGTIRGGARAFKLDALLKLSDVKGTDGKTTLLHFVVQEIIRSEGIRVSNSIMGKINQRNKSKTVEEREEDYRRMGLDLVSGLTTELYNVKKTATIDLDVLASSVSNLSEGKSKLQNLVIQNLSADEKNERFVETMKSFLGYAEKKLKELREDENCVLLHVREITEYFHGDVGKEDGNPLRIFVIVRDFLGMLDHVCKELRSLKMPSIPNPLAPFR